MKTLNITQCTLAVASRNMPNQHMSHHYYIGVWRLYNTTHYYTSIPSSGHFRVIRASVWITHTIGHSCNLTMSRKKYNTIIAASWEQEQELRDKGGDDVWGRTRHSLVGGGVRQWWDSFPTSHCLLSPSSSGSVTHEVLLLIKLNRIEWQYWYGWKHLPNERDFDEAGSWILMSALALQIQEWFRKTSCNSFSSEVALTSLYNWRLHTETDKGMVYNCYLARAFQCWPSRC